MKGFKQFLDESVLKKVNGKAQLNRHTLSERRLNDRVDSAQAAFNEGLATEDFRLKIDNLFFGLFYLASALREVATMSASNLHNNLGDVLSDNEVRQELQSVERSIKERKPNGKS